MGGKRDLAKLEMAMPDSDSDSEEEETWSHIPGNLATIFKKSVSTPSYQTQYTTVRTPWLTNFSEFNGMRCDFVNILAKEMCSLDLPDFQSGELLHSKDGWLLIYQADGSIFLFNAFTFTRINLPNVDCRPNRAVFSSISAIPTCVILVYMSMKDLMVKVARPGDHMWVPNKYKGRYMTEPIISIAAMLLSGCLLRFLWSSGVMVVFDLFNMSWSFHRTLYDRKGFSYFMLDCQGKVMRVVRSISVSLSTSFRIYRLDGLETAWVEPGDISSWSFFVGNPSVGASVAVKDNGMKVYEVENIAVKLDPITDTCTFRPHIKVHNLVDGGIRRIHLPKGFTRGKGLRWVDMG